MFNRCVFVFLWVLSLNIVFCGVLHSQQLKTYLDYGLVDEIVSKDSAEMLLSSYTNEVEESDDTGKKIQLLLTESALARSQKQFSKAFVFAGDALFLAEEYRDVKMKAYANEEWGILSFLFRQEEQALYHFKKAHANYILTKSYEGKQKDVYQSHYNLLLCYQRAKKEELLKNQIDSCFLYGKGLVKEKIYEIRLAEKKASITAWKNNFSKELDLLRSMVLKIENSDQFPEELESFLIIVYGRIALVNLKLGRLSEAKNYYEKALSFEDVYNENLFYRAYLYSKYAQMLFDVGSYKEAYLNKQEEWYINDRYLNLRSFRNSGYLTLKNRYKDQLEAKNNQLHEQEIKLVSNKQELFRFRVFSIASVVLLFVLVFFIASRIRYLKFQKKAEHTNELLAIKNKELTTSMLQLIEREELIQELKDQLGKPKSEKSVRLLLKSIDNRSAALWENFNTRFMDQNVDFYERLQKKVPNLTSTDLKVCALIRLNFSGKEMAYLLGMSLGSVHVARHRLRKKIQLKRGDNLTNFIGSV